MRARRGEHRYWQYAGAIVALLALLVGFALASVQSLAIASIPLPNSPLISPTLTPTPTYTRFTSTPTRSPTATPPCGLAWRGVNSPNPSTFTRLYSVAAIAPDDAWAVGDFFSGTTQTLTKHWDGTSWTIVPSPNQGTYDSWLSGVSAVDSNDVWAVGSYDDASANHLYKTLVLHWRGASWSIVPSPNTSTGGGTFGMVSALSANDVWVVGGYASGSVDSALTAHWDGTAWTIVPNPNPGTSRNSLNGIVAIAPNDVWAVGYYWNGSGPFRTLTEHWNGSAWSVVSSPNPGTGNADDNRLYAVSAVSGSDVWAVGNYYLGCCGIRRTVIEHWNGSAWSIVPSPNGGPSLDELYGVSARATDDVWAVGDSVQGGVFHPLAEHWDGANWSIVPSPDIAPIDNYLDAVSVLASDDVWAVGYTFDGPTYTYQNITERYNEPCVPPTITPTNTASPTWTPMVLPTNTPTATNTPCMVFTPVAEGFEGGNLGTFSSTTTPGPGWSAVTNRKHTGAYAAFAPNVNNVSDQRLFLSSPIFVPTTASSAELSFWHQHGFDSDGVLYYDGGLLEASTDGGTSWQDAGDNITSGGYNCTIVVGHFNPLAGRMAWGGFSAGYPSIFNRVTVDLLPYSGYNVQFRFRLGTDHVVGSIGWWIDDVQVTIGYETCPTLLVGHVTWQGRPTTSSPRNVIPITLTLRLQTGGPGYEYYNMATDATGFFTVPVEGLANGTYNWRVKDPKYLAGSGSVQLAGSKVEGWKVDKLRTFEPSNLPTLNVEMGTQLAADANNDNVVNSTDFTILKNTFGKSLGDPGYDARADFNGDQVVNATDFTLLRNNFGVGGAPPIRVGRLQVGKLEGYNLNLQPSSTRQGGSNNVQ